MHPHSSYLRAFWQLVHVWSHYVIKFCGKLVTNYPQTHQSFWQTESQNNHNPQKNCPHWSKTCHKMVTTCRQNGRELTASWSQTANKLANIQQTGHNWLLDASQSANKLAKRQSRTHAVTHARRHARTQARTHAVTHAGTQSHTHARTQARTQQRAVRTHTPPWQPQGSTANVVLVKASVLRSPTAS